MRPLFDNIWICKSTVQKNLYSATLLFRYFSRQKQANEQKYNNILFLVIIHFDISMKPMNFNRVSDTYLFIVSSLFATYFKYFEFRAKYTFSKQQQSCVDQVFGKVYLYQNLRKNQLLFILSQLNRPTLYEHKLQISFLSENRNLEKNWKKYVKNKIIRNVRVSISSFKIPSGKTDRSSEQSRTKFSIFLEFRPEVSLFQKLSRSRFGAKIQSASKPSFILWSLWDLHHIQQSNVSFM